jgi:putative Mn2+ efflux pump MntP
MDYFALLLVAVSLSMDAFVVSISNGLAIKNVKTSHALAFGSMFGGLQFVMPIAGFLLGSSFSIYIVSFDHWIAFALLAFIGGKMFIDTIRAGKTEEHFTAEQTISFGKLFALGIATSIDALAVGISIALTGWNIWFSSMVIGIVAFIFSFIGVFAGKKLDKRFHKNAGIFGGIVLIGIGVKILIEHLAV